MFRCTALQAHSLASTTEPSRAKRAARLPSSTGSSGSSSTAVRAWARAPAASRRALRIIALRLCQRAAKRPSGSPDSSSRSSASSSSSSSSSSQASSSRSHASTFPRPTRFRRISPRTSRSFRSVAVVISVAQGSGSAAGFAKGPPSTETHQWKVLSASTRSRSRVSRSALRVLQERILTARLGAQRHLIPLERELRMAPHPELEPATHGLTRAPKPGRPTVPRGVSSSSMWRAFIGSEVASGALRRYRPWPREPPWRGAGGLVPGVQRPAPTRCGGHNRRGFFPPPAALFHDRSITNNIQTQGFSTKGRGRGHALSHASGNRRKSWKEKVLRRLQHLPLRPSKPLRPSAMAVGRVRFPCSPATHFLGFAAEFSLAALLSRSFTLGPRPQGSSPPGHVETHPGTQRWPRGWPLDPGAVGAAWQALAPKGRSASRQA